MHYKVIPLRKLLNSVPEERISDIISHFKCTRDKDVEMYLKNEAITHDKRHVSRTYLIFSTDNAINLVAYFSIAVNSFETKKLMCSDKLRRKLNLNRNLAQSYLIGQIGKVDGAPKGLGDFAIHSAINLLKSVNSKVGCRVVRLDCKDALIKYYSDNGFIPIGKNIDRDLNQMVCIIP